LVKVYGPLHCLYKFFIIGYFAAIVVIICYAAIKKSAVSTKHTAFLAAALLGNIALWIVENIAEVQIELLPISYITTEGMILLLYGILLDFETARFAHAHEEPDDIEEYPADAAIVADIVSDPVENDFSTEQIRTVFANWNEIKELTQREKEVLIFILEKRKRKDIAQVLFVTESTIKKHTSNIYKKLEVTSRAELFEKASAYISK